MYNKFEQFLLCIIPALENRARKIWSRVPLKVRKLELFFNQRFDPIGGCEIRGFVLSEV
jgi:hypothetical protein